MLNVGEEPCSNEAGSDAECEVGDIDLSALESPTSEVAATANAFPVSGSGGTPIGFLLLAFGAGLAALATPCVFPMIPLTVSYFTKHTDTRSESIRMASVFGVAIVAIFTLLGLLMAAIVGGVGRSNDSGEPLGESLHCGSAHCFRVVVAGDV